MTTFEPRFFNRAFYEEKYTFRKSGVSHTQLSLNRSGNANILHLSDADLSGSQSHFSRITSYLEQVVKHFSAHPEKLSMISMDNLKHNVTEWNKKIQSHNAKIQKSCFLRLIEKIISFIFKRSMLINPVALDGLHRTVAVHDWSNDTSSMGKWLHVHSADFVAHAINNNNVSSVLADGEVHPAAHLLFERGSVWLEGYLPYQYDKWEMQSNQELRKSIDPTLLSRLKQIWEQQINVEYGHDHLPVGHNTQANDDEIYHIAKKLAADPNKLFEFHHNLLVFLERENPVHKPMAEVYEKCKVHAATIEDRFVRKKYLEACDERIAEISYKIFARLFRRVKAEVRAVKNGIAWGYGNVVVLRGNTAGIIGTTRVRSIIPNEVCLLSPIQNGGKFFSLALNQPDTMIIGPRSILESYSGTYPNICYIEDLSDEQKDFMNVPAGLR